jgi:hypothetical protein
MALELDWGGGFEGKKTQKTDRSMEGGNNKVEVLKLASWRRTRYSISGE